MAFNHENLTVYQRTLGFNARVGIWIGTWDSRHAICDQLPRAAGSMTVREDTVEYGGAVEGIDKARDKARDNRKFDKARD